MDDYYICIDEPSEKRRILLQSSRDLINSLKMVDDFLDFKSQKKELFAQLKQVMDEILVLNSKLFGKLPNSSVSLPKINSSPRPFLSSNKSKLDVLESELADIENKLNSLE